MNADLQRFVREALERGLARPAIRERLLAAGWRAEEVEAALAAWVEVDFPVPVPRRRPQLSARETFLYLVLFATLYLTAFDVGAVLFSCLDRWLPDAVARDYGRDAVAEGIRGGIAGLLIAFPIFLGISTFVGRLLARDPEKRGSAARRWLTYLTLFVAALVIIGDLSFLVQRLLSGELPLRVLTKVLVVLAIAGTIFGHYLADLRGEEREGAAPPRRATRLAGVAIVAVAATIVAGLWVAGSPFHARQRALDAERVDDLTRIWAELKEERGGGAPLPASLPELAARPGIADPRIFADPVTKEPYGYRVVDSVTVELCATFATADSVRTGGDAPVFWRHPRGRHCFRLSVLPPRPPGSAVARK